MCSRFSLVLLLVALTGHYSLGISINETTIQKCYYDRIVHEINLDDVYGPIGSNESYAVKLITPDNQNDASFYYEDGKVFFLSIFRRPFEIKFYLQSNYNVNYNRIIYQLAPNCTERKSDAINWISFNVYNTTLAKILNSSIAIENWFEEVIPDARIGAFRSLGDGAFTVMITSNCKYTKEMKTLCDLVGTVSEEFLISLFKSALDLNTNPWTHECSQRTVPLLFNETSTFRSIVKVRKVKRTEI